MLVLEWAPFGLAMERQQPWNCGCGERLVQWKTRSVRRDSSPASRDLSNASSAGASSGQTELPSQTLPTREVML